MTRGIRAPILQPPHNVTDLCAEPGDSQSRRQTPLPQLKHKGAKLTWRRGRWLLISDALTNLHRPQVGDEPLQGISDVFGTCAGDVVVDVGQRIAERPSTGSNGVDVLIEPVERRRAQEGPLKPTFHMV